MGSKKPSSASLESFRSAYDKNVIVPKKIIDALAGMLKEGAESWCHESELLKRAGISTTDLGAFRAQFEKHIVEVGGSRNGKRVWFADPKVADKARKL